MRAEDSLRKGPWYEEEDERLRSFVAVLGERRWDSIARASGLKRSGKSCRLRWLNYLRPCLKHGPITRSEERLILHLHEKWGNKWADIARRMPGRTDNEIKNYWRSHVRKKMYMQNNETASSSSEETSCLSSDQTSTLEYNTKITEIKDANDTNNLLGIETGFYEYHSWEGGSEYTITSSPYETRLLSDWTSPLSWENNDFGYSWDWGQQGTDTLLWNVDLFNSKPH